MSGREREEERPDATSNRALQEFAERLIREAEAKRARGGDSKSPGKEAAEQWAEAVLEAEPALERQQEPPAGSSGEACAEGNAERQESSDLGPDLESQQAPPGLIQMTIPVGMLQCNCTIVGDPITREALVIDPGDEVGRILELIGRHQLKVQAIVSTHAHIDHVGGLAKLHQYTGAPLLMHRDDLPLYQAMEVQAAFLGVAPPPIAKVDHLLKEGDKLNWGVFDARVIHTPGHTPGSICLYMPNVGVNLTVPKPRLFSGDTLFSGSIGRTDLWGGSLDQIMDSLRGKIMELPDHTEVFPGHGPATLIGEERQSNPFLREK
jgi:hydroxyacylglutathione hydrolase